jgi:hypothetical protein
MSNKIALISLDFVCTRSDVWWRQGVTSLPRVFDTTNYAQVDKFACEEFRSHVIVQKYERIGHRQNTLIEITKCGAARMIA